MWETWVRSLGREDPLEEGMVAHSSSYLEEEPGQRSLVGYSPQSNRRVGHDEVTNTLRIYLTKPEASRTLQLLWMHNKLPQNLMS